MMHSFPKHTRHGFTLVELLVAMSVFVMVAAILVSITGSTSNVWQQGIAHNDRRSAALAVFERMKQDLRAAAQPVDFSGPSLEMVITDTNGSPLLSGSYTFPQAIFWQAPVVSGTNGNAGNISVVGYFIQWVNDTTPPTPKLCRLLINPNATNDYHIYAQGGLSGTSPWVSNTLISNYAPATKVSGYQGQLANDVLGLWVQALDQQGKPITQYPVYNGTSPVTVSTGTFPAGQFDSAKGYISSALYASGSTALTYPTNAMLSGTYTTGSSWAPPLSASKGSLPAAIEVALVTVDSRTALQLTGTEQPGPSTGNLWNDVNTFYNGLPPIIKRGTEIHSTIINLSEAPR